MDVRLAFLARTDYWPSNWTEGRPGRLRTCWTPAGGTWNRSGTILFVPNSAGSVYTVPAGGGDATPNATIDPQQRGHRFPHFLPDGRHFVVHAGGGEAYGLYVGELGSPAMRRIANADSSATYASGQLFFVLGRTLFAQPFDLETLTLNGDRRTVAENVVRGSAGSSTAIALTEPLTARWRTAPTLPSPRSPISLV
jgi:hypothetical protein